MTTSKSVTGTSEEALELVLCIHYPVRFQKDQEEVQALLNSGSEVNVITPAYATKLGLPIKKTNVGAQKIDESALEKFEMVIARF